MAKRTATYPVSQRAAIMRINRKLDDRQLKVTRGALAEELLGKFYVIDIEKGSICEQDVDLTEFGRRIGALKEWEAVVPDK